MTDIVSPPDRSRNMAAIRGTNTKPEMALRRLLHASGLRYRLHAKHLPGKPDIVFPRKKVAVFVNGCFWHRHAGCRWCTTPASNCEFWSAKFSENVKRDQRCVSELLELGWRVATVWECALKGGKAEQSVASLQEWLVTNKDRFQTPKGKPGW